MGKRTGRPVGRPVGILTGAYLTREDGKPWVRVAEQSGVGSILFYSRRGRGWASEQAATVPKGGQRDGEA